MVLPPEIEALQVHPGRPLLLVDVDEVLAMFMHGFERFLGARGLEMRIDRFALFQNIFEPGNSEHLDVSAGRVLFDEFFLRDVEHIEPAEGAADALAALSRHADIVILTNAPDHSREPRARWLLKSGFPYPMVVNSGLKGPAAKAVAAKTRGRCVFIDDLLPNLDSVAADVVVPVDAEEVARIGCVFVDAGDEPTGTRSMLCVEHMTREWHCTH